MSTRRLRCLECGDSSPLFLLWLRRLKKRALNLPALACLAALLTSARAELVALYKFDDLTGTTASESVSSNNATWIPGAESPNWQPAGGLIGGAIRFPGSGSHVNYFEIASIPEINGTPAGMTIAAWFKPEGNSGYRGITMSRKVNGSELFGIGHEADHADSRVDGASLDTAGGTLPANGDWYHVAWVWDNNARIQRLYIDGTLAAGPSSVSAQTITSNADWRIGDDECCSNRNLDGWLDDLAIYNEPLSSADIAALYTNGIDGFSADERPPPPTTDPLNVGLVINEIHHDADPKTEFVEFIELLNTGPDAIDLGGYRFDGIDFVFPAGTAIGVTEYIVVGENPAETYQYDGSLSGDGERITLRDTNGAIVDRVDYKVEFPWPIVGGGTSMQLVNATLDNDLGGSWRPALPTPGLPNAVFADNAPPQLRQVDHTPQQPTANEALAVNVKATDPDGVAGVTLHYQLNAPGAFVPAFLPLPRGTLQSSPTTPLTPNTAFEQNWIDLPMTVDLTGEIFTATIPAQPHRTLIRYRISASDTMGNNIRAPFPDDPSLNFAAFSYDGVPDYLEDDGTVHTAATLTTLPVYHLITDPAHLAQCWAYDSADRVGSVAARKAWNWEGAFVYEGKVYDHVEYRLRQRNDRYAGEGRRSMKFRFRRGNLFAARDHLGNRYPAKWRRMNTAKMSRFSSSTYFGMRDLISSRLWNLAGVLAPEFQHVHFRVIDDAEEAPDEHLGDFYGLAMIFEDVDSQFVENRGMEKGNIYKLKDGESNPLELQKYQARTAVSDGRDFVNIRDGLDPLRTQTDAWLRDHVDWDSWYLYSALGEGFRHYDFSPYHQKNRIWYFRPEPGTPLSLMSIIPHDTDGTWRRGTNDGQWDDPRWGPGPAAQRGRVVGHDLPKAAIEEIIGLDGTDGLNHAERQPFMLEYRNVLREVYDLIWQPETVNAIIDAELARIAPFEQADRARWTGGPATAGTDNYGNTMLSQAANMKSQAFTEELYMGESLDGGRKEWLRRKAEDPNIPAIPTISADGETLISSAFTDPGGDGSFAAMEWRIAETTAPPPPVTLLPAGSVWRYLDDGSDGGAAWSAPDFDDSTWQSGATPAGYGTINGTTLVTPIDFGPDSLNKHITTYFRSEFEIVDLDTVDGFTISLNVDDSAVVYVNGTEVLRDGFASGSTIAFDTPGEANGNEGVYDVFAVGTEHFLTGLNTIAVEVHQRAANSSDMGFDLSIATAPPLVAELKHEWLASWESGELSTFNATITPPAFATRPGSLYRARVRHQDDTGRWSHWSEPVEFIGSVPDISLFTSSIVISEIMYHPSPPTPAEVAAGYTDDDAFEYIEIRNVGDQPVPLDNLRFTKGVNIDLNGTLAPGEFGLVVNDLAAFEFRYGLGLPVVGEYGGKLDNGGERLKLSYGAGIAVREFVYDDASPWPTSPDGTGAALVLIDPFGLPDHSSPFSWRPSAPSPGASDGTLFPGGDLLGYATDSGPSATIAPGGLATLTLERNQLAEDLIFTIQISSDLENWTDAETELVGATPALGTYALATFQTALPPPIDRHFIRLSIEIRP